MCINHLRDGWIIMQNNFINETQSHTTVSESADNVMLSRFINSKLYVMKFSLDVKLSKIMAYFDMTDEKFKLFVR